MLPAGAALDVSLSGREDAWTAFGQMSVGHVPYPSLVARNQKVDDTSGARLALTLGTLAMGFARGGGLQADIALPVGAIFRGTSEEQRTDLGIGDIELRARYRKSLTEGWSVQGAVGAALPSGAYVPRSGLTALQETANYLTLGRGVSWALVDVDSNVAFLSRWNMQLQATARLPLYQAFDGFRWGPEVRVAAGPSVSLWERLTLSALGEMQWRAQSTEVDPFSATNQRIASINTGGLWFTLTPTAQLRIGKQVSVFASLRIPLGQRVEGLQFVPALGGFVGVTMVLPLGTKQTPNAAVAGKTTVIEYGATWCEPCKRLTPLLMEYQASHRDIAVKQIDATSWSADELAQNVPGAVGLPVIVIVSPEGKTLHTLVGERAFDFASVIETESPTTQ